MIFSAPKWFTLRDFIAIFQHLVNFFPYTGDFIFIPERSLFLHKRNKFINIQHCYWKLDWTTGWKRTNFGILNFAKIKDTISGVWGFLLPKKLLRHVSGHQIPLDARVRAHTHTHYTQTPYLNAALIRIFAATCWGKMYGNFLSRGLNLYHAEIAQKNRIIWTFRFNIICRYKWCDFTAQKNRIVWTGTKCKSQKLLLNLLEI